MAKRNPLFEPQREKAGAETFSKYTYQYHWALYRVLQEHKGNSEYALFVEVHEDVVLANSTDAAKARFEFNQVKTTGTKYTVHSLTKLKAGSSVLGKLISSAQNPHYGSRLSGLNLVTVKGFNLPLKNPRLNVTKFCVADLDSETAGALENAIKAELSVSPLPNTLNFVISDLPDQRFQDMVVGEIANVVSSLFAGHLYDPKQIYRVLYDDLERKGMISVDIKDWDEFLDKKALTSQTVTEVINQFRELKDEGTIMASFREVASELGLGTIQGKNLEKSFNRYRRSRVGSRSTLAIDTTKEIAAALSDGTTHGVSTWNDMFDHVKGKLPKRISRQFASEDDFRGAVIFEFILL